MTKFGDGCLLTVSEMAKADAAAIALGISGERLMEAAGQAVADVIIEHGGRRVALDGTCEQRVTRRQRRQRRPRRPQRGQEGEGEGCVVA